MPIRRDNFWRTYHQIISHVLGQPDTRVAVLVLKEDPETIIGYAVASPQSETPELHWIYLKKPFRGFKLANKLLEHLSLGSSKRVIATFMTEFGKKILPARWIKAHYHLF